MAKRYIVSSSPTFKQTTDGVSIQQIAKVKVGSGDTNRQRKARPVIQSVTGYIRSRTPVRSVQDQLHSQTMDRPVWD